MPTTADILTAAALGEDSDWEFKSSAGGFPRSFWETYSAMANSDGGTVLLGVSEKAGAVRFDGLTPEQIAKYKKALWDGLNNRGQVNRNLLGNANVQEAVVRSNGGTATIFAISIPRAGRTDRPVHVGQNPFGGTYRRHHEGDYKCSDEEVRRMIADAGQESADHRILPNFTLEDFDRPSLTQYRQRFRAAKGDHAWLALEDRELLERLGGWRRDRASGRDGPTTAGLLMFGKDLVIRDPEAVPQYFVDYREKLDPTTRWTDRIYPDGTWEANLFQFYSRVWPKLAIALPTPFALEAGIRRDDSPAHEALREALVNALIHADYTAPGGVVVERHPGGFVLENPGTLLVSLDQYRVGGVSECRNKSLQQMFLMIGGGERAGSGADKIRSGWASRSWRAPWISERTQPDRVRLTLSMVSLIPPETLEGLRRRFAVAVESLSREELQALATAELEGSVTNGRLRSLTTLHPSDITKLLQGLCDRGFLIPDGYGRWTSYSLPASPTVPGPANSSPLPPSSSPLAPGSSPLPANSSPLPAGPQQASVPNPNESMLPWPPGTAGNTESPLEQSPGDADAALRAIAARVANKGKATPDEVRSVVIALCRGRYLAAEALGGLLNRNPDRLRNLFLSPMVREGLLKLQHPETPNSPTQAYTASEVA